MSKTMTASVVLVQLDDSDRVTAFVAYGSGDPEAPQHRTEIRLAPPEDITDCRDWIRQAMAALTEAI